ncbi:retropepsin-like aspartic protease [Lutibacter sp.]
MKLKNILFRKRYTKIKLKKINTNHFVLKLTINGVKGKFILDTGASNSCIDATLIQKFKLKNVEDSETKAAGAGATGMETKVSLKNSLEINKWKYFNFTLILLDFSHVNNALTEHNSKKVQGIIGADILEKGAAIIDYKKKCLYLKKLIYKY